MVSTDIASPTIKTKSENKFQSLRVEHLICSPIVSASKCASTETVAPILKNKIVMSFEAHYTVRSYNPAYLIALVVQSSITECATRQKIFFLSAPETGV